MSRSPILAWICVVGAAAAVAACGGGGSGSSQNPNPVIASLSPSNAVREGPPFTLRVTGTGFANGATILWGGAPLTTTWVSNSTLTAQVPTANILVAGNYPVTVTNPPPSGGTSPAAMFNVPCVLAAPTAASAQSRVRLGAYYFDGWAGPLTEFHFNGLLNSPYQSREPLSGWQDNNSCAVEEQLAWAHAFGLSFFVFDWYFNAAVWEPVDDLNSAFNLTRSLPDRHGMQYALLYVNQGPSKITADADWTDTVNTWVGYMKDPDYVRINGKPLLMIIDLYAMRESFGSSAAVQAKLSELRTVAQSQGLPGVSIVGGIFVPDGSSGQDSLFPDPTIAYVDGYDAVSMYGYPFAPPVVNGMLPFSSLSSAGQWIWNQAALKSPLPFIPVAMSGWDPRPWNERESPTNDLMWYSRSPQEVSTFVTDAITWIESNPQLRVEASPTPPIVLIEAWNELGEGSYLTPTLGDGTSYGDSLTAALAAAPPRSRTVLSVNDSGVTDPNRTATGKLLDVSGAPISGANIALSVTPANGTFAKYQLSGQAPALATQAVVGFRVNSELAGPEPSDFSLYQASYIQAADGIERVVNGDFSLGSQSWTLGGQTQLVPSDRSTGQMVEVLAASTQTAALTSAPFAVTADATFNVSFSARVAPSSLGSGYFTVIFLNGTEISRQKIPFRAGRLAFGATATNVAGDYQFSLTGLGTSQVTLEAQYAGDAQRWPAYARFAP